MSSAIKGAGQAGVRMAKVVTAVPTVWRTVSAIDLPHIRPVCSGGCMFARRRG